MSDVVCALHACTKNDTSGNPRRCWVGIDSAGHVVRVTDEGYDGRPAWVRELSDRGTWDVRVNVTPAQYREYIKLGCTLEES